MTLPTPTAEAKTQPGYLLDVNTLLALLWVNHPDHLKADAWLQGQHLATCPISELGFVRISTHPKAFRADVSTARKLLQAFLERHQPQFVANDLSGLKPTPQTSDQVMDLNLAELAASQGLKLATLDAGISHPAVELIA